MKHYSTKKRYCPHQIQTKIKAVELFKQTHDVDYVIRKYHISKASLYRWNKQYDGTRESLENKSHKPKTQHPNAHTEQELKWIKDYCRRDPNISICELYGKLREDKAYSRHPGSLYRVFIRLGIRKKPGSTQRVHIFDKFCLENGIEHKLIRPRTPWHNGKVERSHRSDQERFYNHLSFYSYDDLLVQMKRYMRRSNRIPMTILGRRSPIARRRELEAARICAAFVRATPSLRRHKFT